MLYCIYGKDYFEVYYRVGMHVYNFFDDYNLL